MCKNFALFCLTMCLSATLYGQKAPSEQKPVVSDTPYSFMGLTPGESKAEAIVSVPVTKHARIDKLTAFKDSTTGEDFYPSCDNATVGQSGVGLEGCYANNFQPSLSGGRTTHAFNLRFVDGRLANIFYSLPHDEFAPMLAAITNKYGQPTSTKTLKMENSFGAEFDSVNSTWSNSASEITVKERNPNNLNESSVLVTNTALDTEFWRRAAANGPKI